MAKLTEDQIDDLLYFARTNSLAEFKAELKELSQSLKVLEVELCSAAIDPETQNCPLHYAAANGHDDIISFLFTLYAAKPLADTDSLQNPSITPPAILNAPNSAGNTALHWAALNGHVSTILLLLSYGADPSVLNKAGHDALYEAEINEKSEAVDLLLREGNGLEEVVHGSGEDEEEEEAIKASGAEEDGIGESQTDQGLGKGKEIDGLTEKVEKLNTEI